MLRLRRPFGAGVLASVFSVQTALLLWSRRYLAEIPGLGEHGWVQHGLVIAGVSYAILRQVELLLWVDAEEDTRVSLADYTAHLLGVFTLLAGPILSWQQFRAGFFEQAPPEGRALARLLNRIVNGYIKVSLLSPLLYDLSSLETLSAAEHAWPAKLAFFYLYPWYIYLNFSGYCDVVIGAAGVAGFRLPENFDRPFLATNIQNYWQRWHITFSHWIRSHWFFPLVRALRGSRSAWAARAAMPAAVLVTFLLVGLWHGTDPGFAVFGLLHGLGVLVVAPYGALLRRLLGDEGLARYEQSRALRVVRTVVCYHYLCVTMLFFERPLSAIGPLLWGAQ